jgi:hypothetical protein
MTNPYDPDPRVPDDSWLGLPVTSEERPRSGMVLVYAGIALLLFGAVALWLAVGAR